ncbi:MAG: phosphatidate cytidylyltransferase [Candidatus Cloacimonetes bacterium]|nr:phosphatidate cytidylyltransferase [Candidatus Cloacimonadota bacterium]
MAKGLILTHREIKELYRKSIHISSIALPLSYRYILGYNKILAILILFPFAFGAIILEVIRLENKSFKRVFYKIFGIMLRKHEMHDLTGASYLLTATVFSIALFPREIAFAALSFLSLGDTLAAIFGIRYGYRKIKGTSKSLEGSIACFASCFAYALIFGLHPTMSLIGALAATISEMVNLPINDNVKMPIITGVVMSFASIIMPITR